MAKKKRSKTKQYYRKTTTLKRTGISQYDRDAVIELVARGVYDVEDCELAKNFKFKSCAAFKKKVAVKKRRMAVEKRAKARVIAKLYPEEEWTFETPAQKAARIKKS